MYEGEWIENLPHGHGVYHLTNGDVYEGALLGGHRTGTGQIQHANGDKYEGEVGAVCLEMCLSLMLRVSVKDFFMGKSRLVHLSLRLLCCVRR